MKTKIISGTITLAILLWIGSLFFSKTMLLITIVLIGGGGLYSLVWILYQLIAEQVGLSLYRKELKRRGFK